MFFEKFGFNSLKFFNVFSEYFIGIIAIYILVVFVLLASNIYGILVQKVLSEIIGFILILTCFLIINDLGVGELKSGEYYLHSKTMHFGFNKSIDSTILSSTTKLMVCFFSALFFFIISDFLKDYKLTSFEYLLLLLFAVLGLVLLCSTSDFITTFLAIELISLCSYLLAAFRKNSSYSLEAGIKYLVVGAISSSFFLLGSSFIYAYTGTLSLVDIKYLIADPLNFVLDVSLVYSTTLYVPAASACYDYIAADPLQYHNLKLSGAENFLNYLWNCPSSYTEMTRFSNNIILNKELWYSYSFLSYRSYKFFIEIGMILILLSLFIKLALAPFHLWSLDVYEGSPTISTFFFSTITKLSFFVFLSKFCFTFYNYYGEFWLFYTSSIGFLSVLFGSLGGLRQKKIKTLLAFSSISHMGYSLLAFSTFSMLGLEMLYFYLFTYVLSNIIMWYVVIGLKKVKPSYSNKLSKDIGDFVLLGKSNKCLAFGLSVAFFSLAGIPPLLGFIAKFGVFLSLILQQFYAVAILAILCSVVSTFYYVRLIKVLYFENLLVGKLYSFQPSNSIIFCFSVFALSFLFFNPTLLYLIIHKMILFENSMEIVNLIQALSENLELRKQFYSSNPDYYFTYFTKAGNDTLLFFEINHELGQKLNNIIGKCARLQI
jgi:NADH:ubiquinone oxidoreductase subunit 2 (subunit N)